MEKPENPYLYLYLKKNYNMFYLKSVRKILMKYVLLFISLARIVHPEGVWSLRYTAKLVYNSLVSSRQRSVCRRSVLTWLTMKVPGK